MPTPSVSKTKAAVDMTQGPLLLPIVRYTLPAMAMGCLQLMFNAMDLAVVGRFTEGESATAAVGGCSALINLVVTMFMGISVGAGIMSAHDFGAKRYDSVKGLINTSLTASAVTGILIAFFGFFMAEPLLHLMGTPSSVMPEAVPYMRAFFCGVPGTFVYTYMSAILRSYGDTKRPLIFLTIAGVSNVLMNLFMVIVLHLGALGVGIATAVSQYISAILILLFMLKTESPCRITGAKVNFQKLLRMVAIGIPAGLQGAVFSLSNVLIQSTVNGYGETVMAGNAAGGSLDGFIYISMNAVYYAALTFVGQNVGAGTYKRIKKIVGVCLLVVFTIGVTVSALIVGFGPYLLRIYSSGANQQAVIAAGMNRLKIMGTTYFLCGFMDVGCGVLRGMGKTGAPMVISLLGSCAFRILWIILICPLAPTNIFLLYVSYPISWLLTAACHFLYCIPVYRGLFRKEPRVEDV